MQCSRWNLTIALNNQVITSHRLFCFVSPNPPLAQPALVCFAAALHRTPSSIPPPASPRALSIMSVWQFFHPSSEQGHFRTQTVHLHFTRCVLDCSPTVLKHPSDVLSHRKALMIFLGLLFAAKRYHWSSTGPQ